MANQGKPSLLAVGALALMLAALPAPARAADASPWVSDLHSAFRLIAGSAADRRRDRQYARLQRRHHLPG